MAQLSKKREHIIRQIRQKNRQQIRSGIRENILNRITCYERPLMSSILQDFIDCTHWQLEKEADKLYQTIQNANLQQLDDEQHQFFITDMLYLIHENIINVPTFIKFKKNQSAYTAALVSYVSNDIQADELMYWIDYMGEEDKQLIFTSISAQQPSHQKWISHSSLFNCLLDNAKWMVEAAIAYKQILLYSDQLSKKHIDLSIKPIYSALEFNGVADNTQKVQLRRQLTQIWINFIKIYAKLKFENVRVVQMICLLKKIIAYDISILLNGEIIQYLNELYELLYQDYIQNPSGCQLLLQNYHKLLKNNIQQNKGMDVKLFKIYLFRLCYNNWKSKQLLDRKYHYSQYFYALLQQLNNKEIDNPYYSKLLSLKRKQAD